MTTISGIAGDRLKSFIERIEPLHEERRALGADISEVFKEAKRTGFDPKIMRIVLRHRAMDKDSRDEQETLVEVYERALGMLPPEASHVHAHEEAAE
jgi:uncharacterized protein (UPF0335 family)